MHLTNLSESIEAECWVSWVLTFEREYELSKLPLNSSFCAVTADSKSRWLHGRKAYIRGVGFMVTRNLSTVHRCVLPDQCATTPPPPTPSTLPTTPPISMTFLPSGSSPSEVIESAPALIGLQHHPTPDGKWTYENQNGLVDFTECAEGQVVAVQSTSKLKYVTFLFGLVVAVTAVVAPPIFRVNCRCSLVYLVGLLYVIFRSNVSN